MFTRGSKKRRSNRSVSVHFLYLFISDFYDSEPIELILFTFIFKTVWVYLLGVEAVISPAITVGLK